MRLAPFASLFTLAALAACRADPIDPSSPGPSASASATPSTEAPRDAAPVEPRDGSAPADAATDAPVVARDCPAPARLGLSDVPAGYLRPVKVTIASVSDGDSGRYDFPNAPSQGVRMLYVNTEESFGAEMTTFGVQTKATVVKWITDAKDIHLAVRETSPGSGLPDSDPYDRWLALMFLDGELLQTRLVREGLSAYYTLFGCAPAPVHDALLFAEAEANKAARGIWGPGPHNDYRVVLRQWIGSSTCRPNPYLAPYCR